MPQENICTKFGAPCWCRAPQTQINNEFMLVIAYAQVRGSLAGLTWRARNLLLGKDIPELEIPEGSP